jgi:hypothetical protein
MKINDFILFFTFALFIIIYIFLCSFGTLCQLTQFKNYNITKPLDISYNDKLYNYFISIFGLIIGILLIVIELKYIIPNFGNNIYIRGIQIILGVIILGLYYLPTIIQNYSLEQVSYSLRPLISSMTIILSSSITLPTSI